LPNVCYFQKDRYGFKNLQKSIAYPYGFLFFVISISDVDFFVDMGQNEKKIGYRANQNSPLPLLFELILYTALVYKAIASSNLFHECISVAFSCHEVDRPIGIWHFIRQKFA
jgi:hypothetical protein